MPQQKIKLMGWTASTRNYNIYLINFLNILITFCYEILIPKKARKIFSNQQLGMRVYTEVVKIMELRANKQ
jgi:hypothetical protein